ncbi:hypothetical protein COB72_06650 [bacterium]|nr:MAG: hypothetical protein COB72_06650 [bacterium]
MDDSDQQAQCLPNYWNARCHPGLKGAFISILALAFVLQTYLVYTDSTQTTPLNHQQSAGRQVWLQNNCQACHQLYGFGGFLGPDLTNAAQRLNQSQLESQLVLGQGQMPAFDFDQDQTDSLWAFLVAMNQTGIGQARNPNLIKTANPKEARTSPANIAVGNALHESNNHIATAGFEIFQSQNCQSCHVLFANSSIGAPDLTHSATLLSSADLDHVLEYGRLPKMPRPTLTPDERAKVQAFITYIAQHRASILEKIESEPSPFWASLPWWEFEE